MRYPRISVFISRPLKLTASQTRSLRLIEHYIAELGFDPKTVDAKMLMEFPFREVHALARVCSGGVVLGFIKQADLPERGKKSRASQTDPTPWNQIEAGMLFSMGLPLLVFREPGVSGGIFDEASAGVFIHDMPKSLTKHKEESLREILLKWNAQVRTHYYRR